MIDLRLGCCLDLMRTIPTGSVDMVLCDLPYGTTGHHWDTVIDLGLLWREYNRVCKKNAAVLLFAQCPFDKVLGVSNLRSIRSNRRVIGFERDPKIFAVAWKRCRAELAQHAKVNSPGTA